MATFLQNITNTPCNPAQVLNISEAINDFSNVSIYNDSNTLLNNECLEFSYSLDGVTWSCWLKYSDATNILFELETDYFIRIKVNDTISKVLINDVETVEYSTSLAKCFDFNSINIANPNMYNPYVNTENAMGLYQYLTEVVNSIVGIPIYYIKLTPNQGSKDITFKEYALMDVEDIKQIKLIVQDGQMPSSKPEFSDFGFDFSTDWETQISKSMFATAFGETAKPMEGDLVYIPMMKRMWMVNGAYEEKNEGFMWQTPVFNIALVKYEEKGSVDLGGAQAFVDSLVQTKYEDLFGTNENIMSGTDFVSSPTTAADPVIRVFESDAVRKYVKMSNGNESINAKLISKPLYNRNSLICENMYDFTSVLEESFIIYQKKFCGTDASVSFIINTGSNYCKGTLLKIGNILIEIDITPNEIILSCNGAVNITLKPNSTYFVFIRWSKQMNIVELSAAEYKHPNMPEYLIQPYNYFFDIDNRITNVIKYNIEFVQEEYNDVVLYSFDGKITNIKVYNKYIDNISELLQMFPTNQYLIINDVARKFVELPGIQNR